MIDQLSSILSVDGVLVGHASLDLAAGLADLGVVVIVGHRRRGVGSALVETAVATARSLGVHKVTLSVWPHNDAARALFERHGFVVEGRLARHVRRRDGDLWDLVVMGLVLEP